MPTVTVGIPFYNNEKTILNAIRSIFAQTYQDWELILIDDGSSDNSLRIAQEIHDSRIRIVSDGKNKKLAARLNQIIDLARGEYIARMDADDLCSPERFQQQMDLFLLNPELDVVGTGIIYLDNDDKPVGHSFALTEHEQICKNPSRTFGLCHASIIAKKKWYQQNRYDQTIKLGQDFHLWLRSYQKSRFANVAEPLYFYRLASSYKLKKQAADRMICLRQLCQFYCEKGRMDKALKCCFEQVIKLAIESGFYFIGLKDIILSRRYSKIAANDILKYTEQIIKIKKTQLAVNSSIDCSEMVCQDE